MPARAEAADCHAEPRNSLTAQARHGSELLWHFILHHRLISSLCSLSPLSSIQPRLLIPPRPSHPAVTFCPFLLKWISQFFFAHIQLKHYMMKVYPRHKRENIRAGDHSTFYFPVSSLNFVQFRSNEFKVLLRLLSPTSNVPLMLKNFQKLKSFFT